jgi:hypothetical protein
MSWVSCYIQWSPCNHSANTSVPHLDCTTVEQFRRGKILCNSQKTVSTIQRKLYYMQKEVYQWVERFQSGRTSTDDDDCSGCLTTSWMVESVEKVNNLVQEDRQITVPDSTSWTSAVDLHRPSSTSTSGITKFVQGGCQSSLHMSTNRHMWKYACNLCSNIIKMGRLSCLLPAKWCRSCFGRLMDLSSNTIMIMDRWSVVHGTVLCLKRNWNLLFTVNTEKYWQMELFCIMTMLDLIQQQQSLKQFQNWNLSFSPTQHTVHLITIFLDFSKMCYMDTSLQMTKRWMWWICGFVCNQKHS